MFVKTPQGKRCPFPDGFVVTEKPRDIPDSSFLRRRLKDGSVMLTTKTQSPKNTPVDKIRVDKSMIEKTNKQSNAGGK